MGQPIAAYWMWSAGAAAIAVVLAITLFRSLLRGRVGVDAIALVSMTAALLLGQPLAGVVVAVMYSGGTFLEDLARHRAERDLRALRDRSPRRRPSDRAPTRGQSRFRASSPGWPCRERLWLRRPWDI